MCFGILSPHCILVSVDKSHYVRHISPHTVKGEFRGMPLPEVSAIASKVYTAHALQVVRCNHTALHSTTLFLRRAFPCRSWRG